MFAFGGTYIILFVDIEHYLCYPISKHSKILKGLNKIMLYFIVLFGIILGLFFIGTALYLFYITKCYCQKDYLKILHSFNNILYTLAIIVGFIGFMGGFYFSSEFGSTQFALPPWSIYFSGLIGWLISHAIGVFIIWLLTFLIVVLIIGITNIFDNHIRISNLYQK